MCSGCYNRIPQIEWTINNRHLFFTILEAQKPQDQGAYRLNVFLVHRFTDGLLSALRKQWVRNHFEISLIRALILVMRAEPHDLIPLKEPISKHCHSLTAGIRFQYMSFRVRRTGKIQTFIV